MDSWLKQHLVCPRTHKSLEWNDHDLVSPAGHHYPIVDGIPIMLLEEAEATMPLRFTNTQERLTDRLSMPPDPNLGADEIDPYVREQVVATCGRLYDERATLTRYPIPAMRLPASDGGRLLDIGCGWGRWCVAAARRGYRPVGIDPSLDRVRAARRICRQLGLEATFVVADGRYLPFTDASFDVVFSYSVLQNFGRESLQLALPEIKRVLTPGSGFCMIQLATRWGLRSLMNQARQAFQKPHPWMVRYWPQSALRRMFSELVGPTEISVEGFFSVNAQSTDLDMMPWRYRLVIKASDRMRRLSERERWLARFADSVYVTAHRAPS